MRTHGIPAVVAINRFPSDTDREHDLIRKRSLGAGAFGAEVSEVFGKGGEGGRALATTLDAACEKGGGKFRFLYPLEAPVKEKVDAIARRMYGADGVDFSEEAEADKKLLEHLWRNDVRPGRRLTIVEVAPWAGTITASGDGQTIALGLPAAAKIWVYTPEDRTG